MPPHLHPRSRLTSSLFATTLFASFFVVALPHALPCPAPRVVYADGELSPDGRRRRRRKVVVVEDGEAQEQGGGDAQDGDASKCLVLDAATRREMARTARPGEIRSPGLDMRVREGGGVDEEDDSDDLRIVKGKRECPVPKPGGMVGEILGFKKSRSAENQTAAAAGIERSTGGKGERPP